MARRVFAKIIITGVDDELGKDVPVYREYKRERTFDSSNPIATFDVPHVKWGDECRVEVDMTGHLVNGGHVDMVVEARFYEGPSEETEDLADAKTIRFRVPRRGRPVIRTISLHNRELGGGDWAKVELGLTNSLAED